VPAHTLSYTDTDTLDASTLYYYWVVAGNAQGGTWSTEATVVTDGGAPSAPGFVSATPAGSARVDVNWSDLSQNELGFVVLRSMGDEWEVREWLPAGTTAWSDIDVQPGTFYFYWVWSWGWNGAAQAGLALALTWP